LTSVERERVPSPRPIATREVPLIDRVEEMNVLKEAVYGAVHGEGSLVFVHGEAGIGKTRLVRELGAYARSRGVQVLYGRCPALFRMDGVPPYILWKEVIKEYLGKTTPEQLNRVIGFYPAEVAKLVPELSQKLRAFPQSLPISAEQEQNRLFEAVSQFITNISQENPLLVILDDLQWTDPSSLLLLHYLARGVQKTPLLLLGAYRSTDIDSKHPLSPVLTELRRERLPLSVSLKRMSLEEISEMIEQILKQDDVPPEFCRMVYEKTRGNPFFAEEVVESLKEEGIIYREDKKWKFKEVSKIEFPESVKIVLKARFNRLDDECQNVLTMASFVGNDFTLEALSALTGIEENKLLELMDRMLKTGLIKEREVRGEGVCSFADILVRDMVYEEVSLLKRKKLHGVVGSALEKVYAKKIDEHSGELASHFLESGDKEKALDYFLKAGEKAAKIHANTEAISYFQSALRLLDDIEGKYQEKAHVLETLGDIKRIVGEYDDCLKRWNEALPLRERLDQKEKVAELDRWMARVLWRDLGKTEQAQENFEKALEILKAEPESVELAALYAARASMSYFTEDVQKACSWAEKALELGKKLNASEVVASAYIDLGLVLGATGERKKAVQNMEKALKIALDNSYVDIALRAYNNLAVELPAEESERRLQCYEKGLELAKRAGHIQSIGWLGPVLATNYLGMGKIDKARTLAEESDALNRKTGNLFSLSNSRLILGAFYHIWGEWNKSEQYLKEALSISLGINNTQQVASSYGFLGWCCYDRGEYVQAKEYFEKMLQVEEKTGKTSEQISDYQWVAQNHIALGEIDKAGTLINDMHKFAHEKQNKQLTADADATMAMLLRAERKWNESIELFEKSLQEYEALGARQWNLCWLVKNVLYPYGCAYLERNQPGDGEKARDLLNQALDIFQKIDAKRDVEKTASLLKALDTLPMQTPEKAVSTESIELADVKGRIIATPGELRIGESLELEIEVTNACKEKSILLTKIIEVIPEGFVITKKPESYRREGDCLNMKDKRLGPVETEEVKLVLTPRVQGTFQIKPKIVYLDENGKENRSEPEPVTITVRELGIKGWLKGER
jgi:predicted ATPase